MTDASEVPLHLGLILDGNRRWARSNGLPTFEGHRRGYGSLKNIAKAAFKRGVKYVSAFVFSTENWERTKSEVNYLMALMYKLITSELEELNQENIRVVWLGRTQRLSQKLIDAIKNAEAATAKNTGGVLCFCFNYGGHLELVDAVRKIVNDKITDENKITKELLDNSVYAPGVPPVDLVIRTSGEQRLSGFMLWRIAYAEIYFVDKFWPDFTEKDLAQALTFYGDRERRFGR
jgi:undecaprenyl diphosphate synthase